MAAMPSHDVELRVALNTNVQEFIAKIIRRERYFRAVLVQSRGVRPAHDCQERCGRASRGTKPFVECRVLAGFQGGACAACVWQSHGIRYDHHV